MERREFVLMDANSSKFWNIELDGARHTVTYGRIGTSGQSQTKEFSSADKAKADFDKLVASKLKKGYADAAGGDTVDENDSDLLPPAAFVSVIKQADIYENVKTFIGRKVADYDPAKGPTRGGKTIYRFRSDWEDDVLQENLEHFLATDASLEATGIVIGSWSGDDAMRGPDLVIELLVKNADRLPRLVALFLGDIISEENEMSWIQQTDLSPLLEVFSNLQLLRTRGGAGLELKKPRHDKLRALALESGGLPVEVVRSVCISDFPNLEHLELWLGTGQYGGTSSVQDLQPILSGKLFPKLKYLGLRNCEYADDVAAVVVNSPIVERIETLDLSLGVLTDEGAQALLSLPEDGSLKKVSIHYNYVGKDLLKKLNNLKISIDTSKPSTMDEDDEWRFVAVGE
ncbi:MAG: WGR domain-containing protein [Planctomycetaceae bacterium]|nr:WGR domain-containing protein [Planctomycetaceae bacterium]